MLFVCENKHMLRWERHDAPPGDDTARPCPICGQHLRPVTNTEQADISHTPAPQHRVQTF